MLLKRIRGLYYPVSIEKINSKKARVSSIIGATISLSIYLYFEQAFAIYSTFFLLLCFLVSPIGIYTFQKIQFGLNLCLQTLNLIILTLFYFLILSPYSFAYQLIHKKENKWPLHTRGGKKKARKISADFFTKPY